jgi:hypothetical protein
MYSFLEILNLSFPHPQPLLQRRKTMNKEKSIFNLLTILVICCSALGFSFSPAQAVQAAPGFPGVNAEIAKQANLLEGEATLSGYVYQDGGTPIAGALVEAELVDSGSVQYATSDADGLYEVLLAPGEYIVSVSASGYGKEYYDNTYDSFTSAAVTVDPDTGASGIDFTLSPEAIVTGFVYKSDGTTAIGGASVFLEPVSGGNGFETVSDQDGSYTFRGLASVSYNAYAYSEGYFGEYYLNQSSWGLAYAVIVTQSQTTTGINFTLDASGSITGFILDSEGGVINGASILVLAEGISPGTNSTGTFVSLEDGSYTISGLVPGVYAIKANQEYDPNYEVKYYDNQYYYQTADLVEVLPGQVSGPYNFVLNPNYHNPYFMVHHEWNEVMGWGWAPSSPIALTLGGTSVTSSTDSDGYFYFDSDTIDIIPGMEIVVTGGGKSKTTVVKNLDVSSINVLSDEVSGSAVSGSKVNIYMCGDDDCYRKQTLAGESGNWVIDFSDYVDIVYGSSGYASQADDDGDVTEVNWYKGQPQISVLPQDDEVRGFNFKPNATIYLKIGAYTTSQISDADGRVFIRTTGFDVQPGQLVEMNDGADFNEHLVIDFAVTSVNLEADSLSGTAEPFSALDVSAYRGSTYLGDLDPMPAADEDGNWIAVFPDEIDLLAGDYGWIRQYDDDGDQTQMFWDTPAEGTVSVTGQVFQEDGSTPIANARVWALDGNFWDVYRGDGYTRADGSFEIWVQPGQYYLAVSANGYGGVYYENGFDEDSATSVTVAEVTGASGLDFTLSPEATISGFVYESDGETPISGASVYAFPENGGQEREAFSAPDGSYTVLGLSSGNYRVYATGEGYAFAYYSSPVAVTQPDNTPGININLDRAYPVSGHVYEEDGVTPVTSGSVIFLNQYFQGFKSTNIQEDGSYIDFLPEGQYYFATSYIVGFGGEMYDNACGGTTATQVTVAGPDGVSGIDFQLGPEASISGYVFKSDDVTKEPNGYVFIKPAGGGVRSTSRTTDDGYYEFNGLCSGDYIISAVADGYSLEYYQDKATEAEATPVTLTQPGMTSGINFVLGSQSISISGTVVLEDLVTPLSGVTVRYDATHTAVTNTGGEFLFANVSPGNYTLTPTRSGYVFSPASRHVTLTNSSARMFFVAYPVPAAFAKTSPATASINKELEVTLSWGAAANAESYEYCIDKTNDNACSTWVDVGSDTSVVISGLEYQTRYYWQVRAWNEIAGPVYANGAATAYWNFTTKKLLVTNAPVNVSATDGTYPDKVVITWDAVFGASSYKIFRAATPTGTQTLLGSTTALVYNNVPPAGIKYYYFVQGCNANGCGPKSAYDLGWRTAATITARPVLTLPANAAFLADREVSLAWEFVPGATGYEIQIDTNTYFAAPLTATATTGDLLFNLTMPADGKFYWRVRGLGEGGLVGPWSAAWAFTADTIAPAVPKLSLPIANGVTYDTTPALSVLAVTGAKYYRFQVSETDTFDSILFDSTATTTAVSSTALPYKSGYYWRAKAIDAAGNESDWAAPRFLTVTPQKTPLPGAFTTDNTPTFTWYAVSGASAYELTVTRVDAVQDPYVKPLGIVYSNTPVTALPVGKYEWVIKAKVGDAWLESPVRSLTITPPLLKAPVLVSPAAGAATNYGTPTLEWSPVVDAAKYEIWIDNGTGFTSREYEAVVDGSLTDHELLSSLPADGRYYWKMRTINYLEVPGPWSAYRALVFDTLAPAAPKLYTPANNATVKGTPSFTWLAVAGGKYYQFQVTTSDDLDFVAPIHLSADTIAVTSYKPPLLNPGAYLWRVKARDLAGNWSGWSAARQVTITAAVPVAPILKSPATGTVSVDDTPTFTWNTVGYGVRYRFQISKSLYFTTLELEDTIPLTEYTTRTLPAGTYYWRVQAANELNQWGAWSAKWKIVIQP